MAKFWGLVLESGRRYMQKVEAGFCISMVVLDSKMDSKESPDKTIKLYAERDKVEFLLCNLTPKLCQLPLRVKFGKGETVALYFSGGSPSARLHLSGYCFSDVNLPSASDPFDGQHQSILVKEPKSVDKTKKRVSIKDTPDTTEFAAVESSSDDEDEDIDEGILALTNGSRLMNQDSEEDSSYDEDEEDVKMISSSKKSIQKLLAAEADSSDDDDDDSEDDDDSDDDNDDSDVLMDGSPSPTAAGLVGKQKKQQSQSPPEKKVGNHQQVTPKPSDKNRKSESAVLKTPENQTLKLKQPSSAGHTPMKFFNKGGVLCQDLKVGNGQIAKPGKMMTMYYSGRLKQNNRKFDASESGPGFKFKLGKGEVIKGWDLGVEGMKVGGKRRLSIPANLAYGKKGAPPDIPPNSTLVFDVELKNVS